MGFSPERDEKYLVLLISLFSLLRERGFAMGRPELPVDPAAGPVHRLAHDLRELRRAAGNVSYRAMAKKAGFSVTTLAKAASGERLPSLAVLRAYVQACGEEDPTAWEARWAGAEALAGEERQQDADTAPPYRAWRASSRTTASCSSAGTAWSTN
ncbi:helix-turn-helix domain-containing protein [Streptomyces akebiae]